MQELLAAYQHTNGLNALQLSTATSRENISNEVAIQKQSRASQFRFQSMEELSLSSDKPRNENFQFQLQFQEKLMVSYANFGSPDFTDLRLIDLKWFQMPSVFLTKFK